MDDKYFLCCRKKANFEKIKNGYKCKDCGNFFLEKSLDYKGKTFSFSKWGVSKKIRGRKADFIKYKDTSIFSTLETGKINFFHIDDENSFTKKVSMKVKKSVLEHKLNFDNVFLTITENGVIDIYNIKTGEIKSQLKLGEKYYEHKMKIFPLGKKGKWIYIDTKKIISYTSDFNEKQQTIYFENILGNEILAIKSVDCNTKYDYFLIHICYVSKKIENNKCIERATIILKYKNGNFDTKIIRYGVEYELTYNFESNMYYGIKNNELVKMDSSCNIEKICKLPIVKSYSDGGGILRLEEFKGFPEKLYFLKDSLIALRYGWKIVILDVTKQQIVISIEGNLIQSFFVMAENKICFSAGLNTYIVQLDTN